MMVMVMLVVVLRITTVQVEDFLWSPGTMTARSLIVRDHVR